MSRTASSLGGLMTGGGAISGAALGMLAGRGIGGRMAGGLLGTMLGGGLGLAAKEAALNTSPAAGLAGQAAGRWCPELR